MHPIVPAMRQELTAQADPERAAQMAAYMKTDQPFYGVQSKPCEQIFRVAKKKHPIETVADYQAVIFELWDGVHREDMYQALRVAEMKPFYHIDSWPIYERLVRSSTWWDTLDWIAGGIVSDLYKKQPEFVEPYLIAWRSDDGMWVRRASLLAHLRQKANTNTDLLAETILLLAHEQEFFIRKAIGWALRDYSYADPVWVEGFIDQHDAVLSNLSKREGMKAIERRRKKGELPYE